MIADTHKAIESLMKASKNPKKYAEELVGIINESKGELPTNSDLKLLRSEVKEYIANLKYDIVKWMIGIFIATMAINLTAIAFLARLLLK